MLIVVNEISSKYIKVYGFMIRRFVGETEPINSFMMSCKFSLLTDLVSEVLNLFTIWSLNLIMPQRIKKRRNINSPIPIRTNI